VRITHDKQVHDYQMTMHLHETEVHYLSHRPTHIIML